MSERIIASRYILREPIGPGAIEIVFRAEDRLTGDLVALKQVLPPGARALTLPTSNIMRKRSQLLRKHCRSVSRSAAGTNRLM